MKKIKSTAVISLLLLTALALSFVSCANQDILYSDENAYVSVYVYDSAGKKKLSVDKLRVAPDANNEEEYRRTPTGLYALELACADKDIAAPEIFKTTIAGVNEYTLLTVSGVSAGEDKSGDIYAWEFTIGDGSANSQPVDSNYLTSELHRYDILEFHLVEQTYRTFPATFNATNGAVIVLSDTSFNLPGEKYELTLADYLQGSYTENDATVNIAKSLNITLTDNKKSVASLGGIKIDDTHEWVVLINGEKTTLDLDKILVSEFSVGNLLEVTFEYEEIVIEETTSAESETAAEDAGQ